MLSQHRNLGGVTVADGRPANSVPEQQILDAAYALLLDVGMRRMSMADIARRAGISRATLYRRWPNVQAVVAALTTREFAAIDGRALGASTRDARAHLVDAVVAAVQAVRDHPLLRKIVEVDPEFLMPYLLERRGSSTTAQLSAVEQAVRAGQREGSVRAGRPAAIARAVWLTALSFTLTAPVLVDRAVSLRSLDAQLRELLDRYLTP
jgi:AcrR family transcriptional regulator